MLSLNRIYVYSNNTVATFESNCMYRTVSVALCTIQHNKIPMCNLEQSNIFLKAEDNQLVLNVRGDCYTEL